MTPHALDNTGHYVVSLQKLTKWLGTIAEEHGVDVFPAFPGQKLLMEGERVIGVRVGDKGIARDGHLKDNVASPALDLFAKITILGEGPRGTLTKAAIEALDLAARSRSASLCGRHQRALAGSQAPRGASRARDPHAELALAARRLRRRLHLRHARRHPRRRPRRRPGLSGDPTTDPHYLFQLFKTHPSIQAMLAGAKLLRYGAKAIPEGGLYAMPKLDADGLMLIGDSAGFVDGMRLKGIHLAMKSRGCWRRKRRSRRS